MYQTTQTAGESFGILLDTMTLTTHHNHAAPSQPLDSGSAADWRRAATAQHSMLVEGPEASIQAALQLLTPYLREPVTWLQRGISQALPAPGSGALVMQNIAALDRQDQERLRVWLDDAAHRSQVVATSAYPLFPLVDCGLFDATLYYRLNVVRFSVGPEERDVLSTPTTQRSGAAAG
jgi:hypothetical protein